jgi:hypothetical protein
MAATLPVATRRPPSLAAAAATVRRRRAAWPWWLAGATGLTLALTVRDLLDPDVWWHLAVGRLIAAHGIPRVEPFSFLLPHHSWVGQQWLYELLLAGAVHAGGAGLAMLLMGLVGSGALLLAALAVPRRERLSGPAVAAATLLSGVVAAQVLGVRGQALTVAGSAACLLVLSRWREGATRWVWALPPIFLVWANLHAGFVAGLAILVLGGATVAVHRRLDPSAEAGARLRPLGVAVLLSGAATLLTPAGIHLAGYIGETFTTSTLTQQITEWQSPNFHGLGMRLFEVEALLLVVLWTLGRRLDPVDAVLATAALVATLQAQRNVSLFAVIALPQLARAATVASTRHGSRVRRAWHRARGRSASRLTRPRRRPAPGWFGPATATVVVVVTLAAGVSPRLTASHTAAFQAANEPEGAADYVAAHLPGERLYSTYEWGGYLAERFPAGRVVFVYGESAVLGDAMLQQYLDVHLLCPSWQDVLHANRLTHAVLPDGSREVAALDEVGWRTLYHDATAGAVVMAGPLPASSAPVPDARATPPCSSGG